MTEPAVSPRRHLGTLRSLAVMVGIVVGVGIFKTPALVAANVASPTEFVLAWVAGGVISALGALVYAELATGLPDAGGEYAILSAAYGRDVGFLFAWARLAIVQTGIIAAVAYVFGDFAATLLPLGGSGPTLYAGAAVVAMSAANLAGARLGTAAQAILTGSLLAALALLAIGALAAGPVAPTDPGVGEAAGGIGTGGIGLAMVFVLLTYGGWSEAAYLAGEVRDPSRTMPRVLVLGIAAITLIYLAVNLAYLRVLGLAAMAASDAVGQALAARLLGPVGGTVIGALVLVAALSCLNGTLFTAARATYAMGRDFRRLRLLAGWDAERQAPTGALLVQGAVTLALVAAAGTARDSFAALVEFTAPAFWLGLLLIGLALFRQRHRGVAAPVRAPLYPMVPAGFVAGCLFMLYASLAHTGIGALLGVAVLAAGLPVLRWARR